MKKLKCELCGSVDIVKTADNLFECQYCGCKYTLEQARSLLVSGTVTAMQPDFVITAGKLIKYQGSGVDIVIPDSVIEIDRGVFEGMTLLKSVIFPSGLKKIGLDAFKGCSSLKRVDLPEGIIELRSAFSGCTSLEEISIPGSVKSIECSSFSGCSSLRTVNLGNGIESIESGAFRGCVNLTTLVIPDSVITISNPDDQSGGYVFDNCPNLSQISHPKRFPPRVFFGTKYYENYWKQAAEERDQSLIMQGVCPRCYHKLTKDNWCRKCKKQF